MTPAPHLLSGYLVGEAMARSGRERRWVLAAALVGSIAPDFDVVYGLLGGWTGAGAHRGVTHSFLGALIIAALAGVLTRRHSRTVFLACLAGVLTHIFWDWLNFWGVRALWPSLVPYRGNLLHEQDHVPTVVLLVASLCLWRRRVRLGVVLLLALAPYLALQWWSRERAQHLGAAELAGRRIAVFPGRSLGCRWAVLSAGETDLAVDCLSNPFAVQLRRLQTLAIRDDVLTRASEQSAAVRDFRRKVPFPFAEVTPQPGGGALVVWRDLRVSYLEPPEARPTGIYVWLDAAGRITAERHRWWLKLW